MSFETTSLSRNWLTIGLAVALLVFAAFYRLLGPAILAGLPNFSPLMAIALCGALVLPGWLAFAVPLSALVVSDIVLNLHYGYPAIGAEDLLRYACYGIGVASGIGLRHRQAGLPATFATVAANSLLFYIVTNTASWLHEAGYAKTLLGWLQALTLGLPGYPPTWTFLRNSLVSDLLFAAGFLAMLHLANRQPRAAAVHA